MLTTKQIERKNHRGYDCEAKSTDAHVPMELTDYLVRIDSLRNEVRRLEDEVYRIEQLRWRVAEDAISSGTLLRCLWLFVGSLLPAIIKWPLQPLVSRVRRMVRHIESGSSPTPYQLKPVAHCAYPRKRILHVIANFMTGGSSRLVVDLIEGLGHKYHQEVLTGYNPAPVAYKGLAIHERRGLYEMISVIRRFGPNIVHVHYWGDVDFAWYDKAFQAAHLLDRKVVENVNTPVMPYTCACVDRYVFVSDYVLRAFGSALSQQVVIHPGSDLSLFGKLPKQASRAPCVGMVYRLEPDKLNSKSIDVFVELVRRRPETKILIVGDGSLRPVFEETVRNSRVSDAFEFAGALSYEQLPAAFARMDVFVAPVWKESFGQVSCFAMSMGIPVTGYRVGGLEEIVGDPQLLADPGSTEQLADIIVRLLDDPQLRSTIGTFNQSRVHSLFSVQSMISKYESLYSEILSEDK